MTKRSVAGLLISVFCTSAAALGQVTILGKLVYDLTRSEFDLGLLGLAEFAPAPLLVLIAGAVADRFDRRRVVAIGAAGSAGASLALGWYAGTRATSLAPIFALVVAFGICQAFAVPAARSLPADMATAEQLPGLVARNSVAWQAAIVAGPVLAGLLYTADVRLPFIGAAVLFGVAAVSALAVVTRPPRRAREDVLLEAAVEPSVGHGAVAAPARAGLREALEGLRFVRREPVLLGAISLDLFAVLFGGAVTLLPAIAKDRLGVGAIGLGWLRAAGGLGAGTMTLLLAMKPLRRNIGRRLLGSVAVFGAFTIALGVTHSFAVAFLALVALSAADAVSVYVRATLVPLLTPDDKRGRVLAVENVFIGASNELGGFESGITGQLLGTPASVILGGVATLLVAGGWALLFPGLRRTDRFPSPPR